MALCADQTVAICHHTPPPGGVVTVSHSIPHVQKRWVVLHHTERFYHLVPTAIEPQCGLGLHTWLLGYLQGSRGTNPYAPKFAVLLFCAVVMLCKKVLVKNQVKEYQSSSSHNKIAHKSMFAALSAKPGTARKSMGASFREEVTIRGGVGNQQAST